MKKADIIVIAVFLITAAALYGIINLGKKQGTRADVYIDGKYSTSLPLDKDTVYIPDGRNVKIEVCGGKVAFIESDCPDKICVHTGFIGTAGQTAVCLPNAISVVIRSGKDDEVDAVG